MERTAQATGTSKTFTTVALTLAVVFPAIGHAQAGPCADPWINQAFHQIYGRAPVGSGKNSGECDITRYGNGHWSSYQDLVMKINQHGTGSHAMPTASAGNPNPLIANTSGTPGAASLLNRNGSGIVSQGGGNIVSQGGGNVVSTNASNIVSQGGGNNVAKNAASLIGQDGNGLRSNGK